jgi:hypothetical protein
MQFAQKAGRAFSSSGREMTPLKICFKDFGGFMELLVPHKTTYCLSPVANEFSQLQLAIA